MKLNDNEYYSSIPNIELYPTAEQKQLLDNLILAYKIVFNWALGLLIAQYDAYRNGLSNISTYSYFDLTGFYYSYRITNPFLMSLPCATMLNAIKDAWEGYHNHILYPRECGIPYFKSIKKFESMSSFRPSIQNFYFEDNLVRVQGLPFGEKILTNYHTGYTKDSMIKYSNPCIIRNNLTGKYYLSFTIAKKKLGDTLVDIPVGEPIGVDLNKHYIYACSNGIMIESRDISRKIEHLADLDSKLQYYYDRYGNSGNFSNNAKRLLDRRNKVYAHISNIHKDICYKGSIEIIKCNPEAIILETLDIKSMFKDHYIADDLQFYPLGISRDILIHQVSKYDIPIVFAPENFPSSSICSNCGTVRDIGSSRVFICPNCGNRIDRDLNAAINLKNWYIANKDNI